MSDSEGIAVQQPHGRRAVGVLTSATAVLGVCVIGLMGVAFWMLFVAPQTSVEGGRSVRVEVKAGSSTKEIARVLTAAGVIPNANMFRLRARLAGADARLKPGIYDLTTRAPFGSVVGELERGPDGAYVTVTIPEGYVVEQIASRFQSAGGISSADFLRLARGGADRFVARHPYLKGAYKGSLEGYLFPKTYEVRRGEPAEQAIDMMLTQFDFEVAHVDFSRAQKRGLSRQQVLLVASMIERESRLSPERPPGSISNPGLESIKAAAGPADTKLLYYVLTGRDGSHTFATNLSDFLVAKAKSKRVFGK